MIERYILPDMGKLWTLNAKYQKWLEVEIYACEAQAELGNIPPEALAVIKEKARFDSRRIDEIEREVNHDVIAFLTSVAENVGPESRYIHLGLTSTDVVDTAQAALMVDAANILIDDADKLIAILRRLAVEHKDTVMMGRTHGVHAEPTTFGLKMALWLEEMKRNRARLESARETVRVGKISGAVGNYAHLDPFVEEYVCAKLGLKPAPVSTQILQRDRHAEFLTTLAIVAGSLDKFAVELRNLQRTEILEVEEPFSYGQKGSSAMPHKKNPVVAERISGLSRVIRGHAVAALENMALWHERDISHSSAERMIIPDSTMLLHYMFYKMIGIMDKLVVHKDRMAANVNRTGGLIYSQRVLLALVEKGLTREEAYRLVQNHALAAWEGGATFTERVMGDPHITSYIPQSELQELFTPGYFLRNVDKIYRRLELI